MNVKKHHTQKELLHLYKTERDPGLARRINGVYLAGKGLIPVVLNNCARHIFSADRFNQISVKN